MAGDTFYAWSTIVSGSDKGELTTIPVGEAVTAEALNVDEEGFNQVLLSGSVRPYPYPDMPDTAASMSPLEFMKDEATKSAAEEEEKLMALMDPAIVRASLGPVREGVDLPQVEGVEEATGPSEKATAKK